MVDKLIIAPGSDPDQFYATGLALHGTFITLVRGKQRIIAAGGFEYLQVKKQFPSTVRFEDLGATRSTLIKAFCKRFRVSKPLMPASTRADVYALVPGAQLTAELFPQRRVKTSRELRAIRTATKITELAIRAVRDELASARVVRGKAVLRSKPLTSEHLKRVAAVALAEHNYACPDMIIASGAQSALPHHEGSGVITEGAVIVDIFPRSHESRYFSDMTRTFVVGRAPKYFDERYAAVLAAHKTIRSRIRDGAKNVEECVLPVFHRHGFLTDRAKGRGYIHSFGHGVGLAIHEAPGARDVLKAGNVVTVEPGLYYDYGIRVEDIGVVTKKGFTNFSKISKDPYL